jgi:hypothetical protein
MEYFKVLSQHLYGGTEENHKKTSLRKVNVLAEILTSQTSLTIVNVLVEILTSHFLNTSKGPLPFEAPCWVMCLSVLPTAE